VIIWEVELFVYGSVVVSDMLSIRTEKARYGNETFFSDIKIRNFEDGIVIKSTAFAPTRNLANSAAMVFIGQMLDCLVLEINEALFLSFDGRGYYSETNNVKRFITTADFTKAFEESRLLSRDKPTFLRAVGWYRKGIISEDPFDKFLALWNSLEIIASKYHPRTERARNGSISQLWESFKALWGECEEWPFFIRGKTDWIDQHNEIRKNIAHGITNVHIDDVEVVLSKLDTLREIAYLFLKQWRQRQLFNQGAPTIIDN
jgi:glutaredoxin-related protein